MSARSRPISHRDALFEEIIGTRFSRRIVHRVALGIGIGAETRFTGRIAKITLEVVRRCRNWERKGEYDRAR